MFRERGLDAYALEGGFDAWRRAGRPLEPKPGPGESYLAR